MGFSPILKQFYGEYMFMFMDPTPIIFQVDDVVKKYY